MVSIPFRIGKKVIAHHTLLNCAGQDTPSEKPSPSAYKVGDVIWARAPSLPAWPGKILSADDVGAARVPSDKVSAVLVNMWEIFVRNHNHSYCAVVMWSLVWTL